MKKLALQILFKSITFSYLIVFSSFDANCQINQFKPGIAISNQTSNSEIIQSKNNLENSFQENMKLLLENKGSIEIDSFVYETFDKNLSKWIRTAKYKSGIIQNASDTIWFIAIWIDSTKTWKEYPYTSVQYNSNGRLVKKEKYENILGNTILVNSKTEQNYSFNNENKTEITINYKRNYLNGQLVNYSKTEITYDEKDRIVAKISFSWDKYKSKWDGTRKDTIEFDKNGNNTMTTSYYWIIEKEKWYGNNKTKKEYNKDGEMLQETLYAWDASIQSWYNFEKTEFTKGDKGENITSFSTWNIESSEWKNINREITALDSLGLPVLQINLKWNLLSNQWENSYKLENKFDTDSNQVLRISYNWDNDSNIWKGIIKIEKEFNSEKKELSITESAWNDSIGNWINSVKEIFNYDQYGNLELNEIYQWNFIAKEWQFSTGKSKSEYKYNDSGKVTEQVYFDWNSLSKQWQYDEKNEYGWDNQNRLILRINSIWNIEKKEWIKTIKQSYAFDSEGSYILNSYSRWDEIKNDWMITNLYETIRNQKGNIIGKNISLQLSGSGDVYQGVKDEWESNERGQILLKISYNWDKNLQLWNAISKITRSYNELGLIDTLSYFNMDIAANEWTGNNRTIYFYSGTVDIKELSHDSDVKLYPNPASDFVTIEITNSNQESKFELFDLKGKLVIRKSISNSDKIELQTLKNGVYPWKISSKEKKYSGKLIIKK